MLHTPALEGQITQIDMDSPPMQPCTLCLSARFRRCVAPTRYTESVLKGFVCTKSIHIYKCCTQFQS